MISNYSAAHAFIDSPNVIDACAALTARSHSIANVEVWKNLGHENPLVVRAAVSGHPRLVNLGVERAVRENVGEGIGRAAVDP